MTIDQIGNEFAGFVGGDLAFPNCDCKHRESRAGWDFRCLREVLGISIVNQNSGACPFSECDARCLTMMSIVVRATAEALTEVLDMRGVEHRLGLTEPVGSHSVPQEGLLLHSLHQLVVNDQCPLRVAAVKLTDYVQPTCKSESRKHGRLEYPVKVRRAGF